MPNFPSCVIDEVSVSKSGLDISGFPSHDQRFNDSMKLEMGKANKGKGKSRGTKGRWTNTEHDKFLQGIRLFGKDWRKI